MVSTMTMPGDDEILDYGDYDDDAGNDDDSGGAAADDQYANRGTVPGAPPGTIAYRGTSGDVYTSGRYLFVAMETS